MTASARTRLNSYQRLVEISRDLASTLELDKLLLRIISAAVELSQAGAASILLYDESTRQLHFQVATNMTEPQMRKLVVPLEGSIAGWVIEHKQSAIIPDVHEDPRFFDQVEKLTQIPSHSMVAIPLVHKDKPLGVLEVINKQAGKFSATDLEALEALSAQAAVAIENARLFQQSDLISELIHEIRTPLTSLDTAAYLLQRPDLPEDQRSSLVDSIRRETQRLNELASTFLDLARLESGRVSFQIRPFEIPPVLENCIQMVTPIASQRNVNLRLDLPPDLPCLVADPDRITQVLMNLLSNALKYNHPGGQVTVSGRRVGNEIAIAVADTGLGIPSDALPRVFEKFYRVPGNENGVHGTGLGLAIVKRIVEGSGGRIEATSRPGDGSQFTVYLPAALPA